MAVFARYDELKREIDVLVTENEELKQLVQLLRENQELKSILCNQYNENTLLPALGSPANNTMGSRGCCNECNNSWQTQPGAFATVGSPLEGSTDCEIPDSPIGIMRGPTSPTGGTSSLSPPPFCSSPTLPRLTSLTSPTAWLSDTMPSDPYPDISLTSAVSPTAWLCDTMPSDPYPDISLTSRFSSPMNPPVDFPQFQYAPDISTMSSPGRFSGYSPRSASPTNFVLQPPPLGRTAQALAPASRLSSPMYPPVDFPQFQYAPDISTMSSPGRFSGYSPRSASPTNFVLQPPPLGRSAQTLAPASRLSSPMFSPTDFPQFQYAPDISTMSSPGRFSGYSPRSASPTNFALQPAPLGWKAFTTPYLLQMDPYSPMSVGEYTLPWAPASPPSRFPFPPRISTAFSPGRFTRYPTTGTTPTNLVLQPPPLGRAAQALAPPPGPTSTCIPVPRQMSPVGGSISSYATSSYHPSQDSFILAMSPFEYDGSPIPTPPPTPPPFHGPVEERFQNSRYSFPRGIRWWEFNLPPLGSYHTPMWDFHLQQPPLGRRCQALPPPTGAPVFSPLRTSTRSPTAWLSDTIPSDPFPDISLTSSPGAWLNDSIPSDPYCDISFTSRPSSPAFSPADFSQFQYGSDISTSSSPGRFCGYSPRSPTPTNFVLQPPPAGRRVKGVTAPCPAPTTTQPPTTPAPSNGAEKGQSSQ